MVAVRHLRRDAIARANYLKACFERTGLLERLTVAAAEEGQLLLLNLYRLDASGPFTSDEIAVIEDPSRFLAALATRHKCIGAMLGGAFVQQMSASSLCSSSLLFIPAICINLIFNRY